MSDKWPMIAGVGAGVAAAAAVGQMIVSAVGLGSQAVTDREVDDIKQDLKDIHMRLRAIQSVLKMQDIGEDENVNMRFHTEINGKVNAACRQASTATSIEELRVLEAELELAIQKLGIRIPPREVKPKKNALVEYMERRGRQELPFH